MVLDSLRAEMPVDLFAFMLGTNDLLSMRHPDAAEVAEKMDNLIGSASEGLSAEILLIAPPHILDAMDTGPFAGVMGSGCVQKSRELARFYEAVARRRGCAFLDAQGLADLNATDGMHLTRKGHRALARHLAELVPALVDAHEK
jgi:lysophospholipase L1-like esterase